MPGAAAPRPLHSGVTAARWPPGPFLRCPGQQVLASFAHSHGHAPVLLSSLLCSRPSGEGEKRSRGCHDVGVLLQSHQSDQAAWP